MTDSLSNIPNFSRAIPFRGLLHDVRGSSDIQQDSGLGWKVVPMPVAIQGRRETRKADGYQALVRSDNGGLLSIVSDKFKPHQNSEILRDMKQMAEEGQAEIVYAGELDEGRKVVAVAKLEGEFEIPGPFPDNNSLLVVISGGHEVGTPFRMKGMAFRLVCSNGAFFTKNSQASYGVTHRQNLTAESPAIRRTYDVIRDEFSSFGETAKKLQGISMNLTQSHLLVAELLKPGTSQELASKISESPMKAGEVWEQVASSLRAERALDAILEASDARNQRTLVDAIYHQTGSNGATLWTGYNGITEHIDHTRGRTAETGVDAALFGEGARLKERTLEVAKAFAA